ncbi:proton channel OTOP3 isoform X1 [Salmo trutta]|uniref:proton channel OTOP3 isoform X1 n=1 Tax=Salmo trutta TaxID=8032 RepID=UPI001130B86E|nr:proton channel OTOP3-like isoform X1 [Salmo trutta]
MDSEHGTTATADTMVPGRQCQESGTTATADNIDPGSQCQESATTATADTMVPESQCKAEEEEKEEEEEEGSGNHTHPDPDPVLVWAPSGRRLLSGLLGLNVVLLGAALVAGQAFNPQGLRHQEPQIFMLLLMCLSLAWMLWYLLWVRRKPGISPHKDHHAGGITVTVVLMLFAAFSLLMHLFKMGYYVMMKECKPVAKVLAPFIEAPFLGLQTYLLWAHSKDCIHKHKIITRSGLMVTLSADLLLWLNAVTEDTVHLEIETEKEDGRATYGSADSADSAGLRNATLCQCSADTVCLFFRKGYEVLYPFNMEYYLMAGCMLYVMWKNVGRRMSPGSIPHHAQKITLRIVHEGGILFGPLFGGLVLIAGVVVFILYQVWVNRGQHRPTAFLIFYGYHLAVMPIMSLCSLTGVLVHKLERRADERGHNPTRSLDVALLVGAALGQLALSYFSLVAALAVGPSGPLGSLDLSYSLLSLLELLLQNVFIINGLHRHPNLALTKGKGKERISIFMKRKTMENTNDRNKVGGAMSLLEKGKAVTAPPGCQVKEGQQTLYKRVTQEICAFLILSNIMLWMIPAFGAHPQFENGLGKQFFGFSAWFVLVNLVQPLGVFYRMHSVGALIEILVTG